VSTVHVIVPEGIDDPTRPSGGNLYDRKVCDGLAALDWSVHERPAPGAWPLADHAARAGLAALLGGVPAGELVLVDGLIGSGAPEVLIPQAARLRIAILLHMPLGDGSVQAGELERSALSSVSAVVTTSHWARQWVLDRYGLPRDLVHVVQPGAELADIALGTPSGEALLCVGAVWPAKGHDLLVSALAMLQDLPWHLTCVGASDLDVRFVEDLRSRAAASGIADRLSFHGPVKRVDLDIAYDSADLLVSASRAETYGMAITEALAHGLPVVATNVGGIPEALGRADDRTRAGVLVAPDDAQALATALRGWLDDPGERRRLRVAAQARRLTLSDWDHTSRELARALAVVAS
jgi:glycosyltransferase involved in cell wall biosynthesis